MCFEKGYDIKEIERTSDGFTALCSAGTYKKLHTPAFRSGGTVRIIRKSGLPFLLKPLKNRWGFFTGAVAFALTVSLLTGFVWQVKITGNSAVGTSELTAFAEMNGLKSGVPWSSVDRDTLCAGLMRDFDGVAWAHINRFGSVAVLEINETKPVPVPDTDKLKGRKIYRRELTVTAYRQQSDMRVLSSRRYCDLYFYMLRIPLYVKKPSGDLCEASRHFLTVNKNELPIGVTVTEAKILGASPRELSDSELLSLAEHKLALAEEQELDGYGIINKSVTQKLDADKCTLTGAYILSIDNTD